MTSSTENPEPKTTPAEKPAEPEVIEYTYPLPSDVTISDFEKITGLKKEAINLVLVPKIKTSTATTTTTTTTEGENINTSTTEKSSSVEGVIPLSHLEDVTNITIQVKKGPKIEHLNTAFLAALVGNVDYLKKIIANPRTKEHCFVTSIKESPPSHLRSIAEFACRCSNENTQTELLQLLYSAKIFEIKESPPIAKKEEKDISDTANDDNKDKDEQEKKKEPPCYKTLLDKPNQNGTYPIFVLAQEGNLSGLRFAHEVCGMSLTQKTEDDGLNAFLIAVRFEKIEVVKYFLEQAKVDPEVKSLVESAVAVRSSSGVLLGYEGAFACACSVGRGNVELLRLLAGEGFHKLALDEAHDHSRPMKILVVSKTAADGVTRKDPSKVYRKYKHFPVLPDSATTKGASALGAPLRNYQLSVGGDRSECNAPLHAAISAKDLAVVKYLCEEAGFDIDKDALVGLRTPLQIATRQGLNDIAEYLVTRQRCDVNKKSKDGSFPLYTAAYQANNELVELLLKHGANTSFTWHGATPFFAAVSQSHVATAKLLVDYSADVSTQFEMRGPSQYARERGLKEMTAFLEENRIY